MGIGSIYAYKGDFDKALDFYCRSQVIFEELLSKGGMAACFNNIGNIYFYQYEYDKALKYANSAMEIFEEIGEKSGFAGRLHLIGSIYFAKGNCDKALEYSERALKIHEETESKRGIGEDLTGIGMIYCEKGDYNKSLNFLLRAYESFKLINDVHRLIDTATNLGEVYLIIGDYMQSENFLEESIGKSKELDFGNRSMLIRPTIYLYISYKHLGKDYDVKEIHRLIKDAEDIEFKLNFRLYELLEDKSYLETAYNQVQEKASAMDDGKKFLSYPIPKAIVEEYEKNKDK